MGGRGGDATPATPDVEVAAAAAEAPSSVAAAPHGVVALDGDAAAAAAWVAAHDTFLLDCDGVVWRAADGVPGVADTVAALKAAGKRVFFVSNNSTKSRASYVAKLAAVAGIAAREEEVVSSAYAAAAWCAARGIRKVYAVGMEGLVSELRAAGMEVVGPEDSGKTFGFGALTRADLDPSIGAVVAGFDGSVSYYKLARAAAHLRYLPTSCAFVATNRDATFPDTDMLIPGGGIIIAALELGSGRAPDVVAGKPHLDMLRIITAAHGLDLSRTAMVGDRLDTDIMFGAHGGVASRLLVLTGVNSLADVAACPPGDARIPTHVIASFGDLGALLAAAPPA